MKFLRYFVLAGLSAVSFTVTATEADAEVNKIKAQLELNMPGFKVPAEAIKPSPVQGIYMVVMPPDVFYVSQDGRFVFDGSLIDTKTRLNLSEVVKGGLRTTAINKVGEENMITYGPKDAKHTITVFTDIDCGYCRKLHSEIDAYNKAGIRVRYMAYPRAGVGSDSYKKAVSVWCADDRASALTRAKSGQSVPAKECSNPVEMEYNLGTQLGIRGTPAIVTEQGNLIPGYVPADRLKGMLDQAKN